MNYVQQYMKLVYMFVKLYVFKLYVCKKNIGNRMTTLFVIINPILYERYD